MLKQRVCTVGILLTVSSHAGIPVPQHFPSCCFWFRYKQAFPISALCYLALQTNTSCLLRFPPPALQCHRGRMWGLPLLLSKQTNNSKPGCHWENPLQEWKTVDLPTMPVTEALLFYYFFSWFVSLKRSLGLFHSINWEVNKSALSAEDIAAGRAKAGC